MGFKNIKKTHLVNYTDDLNKRLDILKLRKNELIISEYQTLFEYYEFCSTNPDMIIGYNPVKSYLSPTQDWVFYLTLCQLFPNELKNGNRDLYSEQYKQIMDLPKLTGDLDNDTIIFNQVISNYFFESKSPVRNALMLYYIHFAKNLLM